jgi:hypothetical protein
MKNRRKPGKLSETITLYKSTDESPSGHVETRRSAILEVDSKDAVILHEKYQHLDFHRSHNDETTDRKYKIGIEKLVELIKKHGKLVRSRS